MIRSLTRRNYKKFLRRNRFTIRRTDILSQIIRPEAADGKFRGLRPSVCIRCPVFFGKTCIDLSADRRNRRHRRARRDRLKTSRRHGTRHTSVRLRRGTRLAVVAVSLRILVIFLKLIRKELREAGTDLRGIGAYLPRIRWTARRAEPER